MPTIPELQKAKARAEAAGDAQAVADIQGEIDSASAPVDVSAQSGYGAFSPPAPLTPEQKRNVGSLALKVGVPLAVAPFTGGMSMLPAAMTLGGASVLGNILGDAAAGDTDISPREFFARNAGAFALGATPVPGIQAAAADAGFIARLANLGKNTAKNVGATVGAGITRNVAEDMIRRGTVMPYDDEHRRYNELQNVFRDTFWPSVVAAGITGVGTRFANANARRIDDQKMQDFYKLLDINNPTLGQIRPQFAGTENRMAIKDTALQAKILQARSPMTRRAYELIGGEAPANEQVASALSPYIGKIDEAEAAYQKAEAEYTAALAKKQQLNDVAQKAGDDAVGPARIQATADEATALANQAEALATQTVLKRPLNDPSYHAEKLTELLNGGSNNPGGGLVGVVKSRYGQILNAGGINLNQPLPGLTRQSMLDAVKQRLAAAGELKSDNGKQIMEAIRNAGGDSVAPVAIPANLKGRAAQDAEKIAQDAADTATMNAPLTLQEVAELRKTISDKFGRTIMDNKARNRAEAIASMAYDGVMDVQGQAVSSHFGPQGAAAYDTARNYYRDIMKLRQNEFGRNFLDGTMDDATVAALGKKMANGQLDEINNFKSYVNAIAKYDPSQAALAESVMQNAVRNSLVGAATKGGVTDMRALYANLSNYDRLAGGGTTPFKVDFLGFGNSESIRKVNTILKKYTPDQVGVSDIGELMQHPDVQNILLSGGAGIHEALKPGLAAAAFKNKVEQSAMLAAAGQSMKAKQAALEAETHAATLGKTRDDMAAAFDAAKANPLIKAFEGYGQYNLSNEATKVGGQGTISGFLQNMKSEDARLVLKRLRDAQPDLADLVERRMIADHLEKANIFKEETAAVGQTRTLDYTAAHNYFFPPNQVQNVGQPADWQWLKKVIEPSKAYRIGKFMENVAKYDDLSRQGIIDSGLSGNLAELAGVIRGVKSGGPGAGSGESWVNKIIDLVKKGNYKTVATFVTEPGFANEMYKNSGDVAKALSSMPVQRAYPLVMDRAMMDEQGRSDQPAPTSSVPPPPPAPTAGLMQFQNVGEANAAAAKGLIKAGQRIMVGGKSGTWQ